MGRTAAPLDRKSTRLNSSHLGISYAVFCLKKTRRTELTNHARLKKPAISQVQMHFLTQPPFGSNTKAIAHDQHPDEQLRIDRGAAHSAADRRQIVADV